QFSIKNLPAKNAGNLVRHADAMNLRTLHEAKAGREIAGHNAAGLFKLSSVEQLICVEQLIDGRSSRTGTPSRAVSQAKIAVLCLQEKLHQYLPLYSHVSCGYVVSNEKR